jgi:hypothetical protein
MEGGVRDGQMEGGTDGGRRWETNLLTFFEVWVLLTKR